MTACLSFWFNTSMLHVSLNFCKNKEETVSFILREHACWYEMLLPSRPPQFQQWTILMLTFLFKSHSHFHSLLIDILVLLPPEACVVCKTDTTGREHARVWTGERASLRTPGLLICRVEKRECPRSALCKKSVFLKTYSVSLKFWLRSRG